MVEIALVFPHHLFSEHPAMLPGRSVWMTEEHLFFRQYRFHKQKLGFHRASMQFYKGWLEGQGFRVHYTEAPESQSDIRKLVPVLASQGVKAIHCCEPGDDWLRRRLQQAATDAGITLHLYPSPLFLNTLEALTPWFSNRKQYFQTDFYTRQRKLRGILLEDDQKPIGGKWTFDTENRQRYPKGKQAPGIQFPQENQWMREAKAYVEQHFPDNYGHWGDGWRYPVTFKESGQWLDQFIQQRLLEFGAYEDAMVRGESVLHHSLLTPMLNVGLLTPKQILDAVLERAVYEKIPLNSIEGFVRQIIGWREFIRGVYEFAGRRERITNFWGFNRKIPQSFWEGSTGIEPMDNVIKKVLATGYCHHIERLMVLGNFMLLCEFDPDEVYRWFMELFVDAYDWVMVPNVYGMSQFADGGLMSTKPYISGSNYLMKMSDFPKGDWQRTWDGLFWHFLHVQRDFFLKNPRLGMLVKTFDKMSDEKRLAHLTHASEWLAALDS
jgi:deoxyribodipyrimidine photolyase-related protein